MDKTSLSRGRVVTFALSQTDTVRGAGAFNSAGNSSRVYDTWNPKTSQTVFINPAMWLFYREKVWDFRVNVLQNSLNWHVRNHCSTLLRRILRPIVLSKKKSRILSKLPNRHLLTPSRASINEGSTALETNLSLGLHFRLENVLM